jgi:hypothetical protein
MSARPPGPNAPRDPRPSLRIPDFSSIEGAPQRSVLHVLSTATRCARLSLLLEHRDLFEGFGEDYPLPSQPCPLDIAARQLAFHMDELIAALDLYEIALQAHRTRLWEDDMLF